MSHANYTYYYNNHFVVTNDVILFISVAARGEWCVSSKRVLGSVFGGEVQSIRWRELVLLNGFATPGVGDARQKGGRLFYSPVLLLSGTSPFRPFPVSI